MQHAKNLGVNFQFNQKVERLIVEGTCNMRRRNISGVANYFEKIQKADFLDPLIANVQ